MIRDAKFLPKTLNLCPHPSLFLISHWLGILSMFISLPLLRTPSLTRQALITRALTFLPLLIAGVPLSWRTVHPGPDNNAYRAFKALFRHISTSSLIVHLILSLGSVLSGLGHDHDHRHSSMMHVDSERRDAWERTIFGFGKMFGAAHDHPIVAGISRDVLLSSLSLGLWAAVRAIAAKDILECSVRFYDEGAQPSASSATALSPRITDARYFWRRSRLLKANIRYPRQRNLVAVRHSMPSLLQRAGDHSCPGELGGLPRKPGPRTHRPSRLLRLRPVPPSSRATICCPQGRRRSGCPRRSPGGWRSLVGWGARGPECLGASAFLPTEGWCLEHLFSIAIPDTH